MIGTWRISFVLALALGACGGFAASEGQAGAPNSEEPSLDDDSIAECSVPADCEPAASTCCECPSFSLPVTAGFGDSCGGVDCNTREQGCSAAVEATCNQGRCELLCQAVTVIPDEFCTGGFVRDEFGCLLKECAPTSPTPGMGCIDDDDCVQVPADCCGCSMGGADTSVPLGEETEFTDSLGCDTAPSSCPGVDVCDAERIPRCLQGECRLAPAPGPTDMDGGVSPPPGDVLCGSADYPPCGAGQVCVLNDPEASDANRFGVGVCRPE